MYKAGSQKNKIGNEAIGNKFDDKTGTKGKGLLLKLFWVPNVAPLMAPPFFVPDLDLRMVSPFWQLDLATFGIPNDSC